MRYSRSYPIQPHQSREQRLRALSLGPVRGSLFTSGSAHELVRSLPLARLPSGWTLSPIWSEIAYITINDREEPISLVFKVVTPERDR